MPKVVSVLLLLAVLATSCQVSTPDGGPAAADPVAVDPAVADPVAGEPSETESADAEPEGVDPPVESGEPATAQTAVFEESERLHNILVNSNLGEIVVLTRGSGSVGDTLYVTQDGQVVLVAGHDRSERTKSEYSTWEVGPSGFQQMRDSLQEIGAAGRGRISTDFDGIIAILGAGTSITFSDDGNEEVADEVQVLLDDFAELWTKANDPDWYESATPVTTWTPYRVMFEVVGDIRFDERTAATWPFGTSPVDLATIEVGQDRYMCFEGADAALAWESVVLGFDFWNQIYVEHEGSRWQLRATPFFPGTSLPLPELPETCNGPAPRDSNDDLLVAAWAQRTVARFSSNGNPEPAADMACPSFAEVQDLVLRAERDDTTPSLGCFSRDFLQGTEYGSSPVLGFAVGIDDLERSVLEGATVVELATSVEDNEGAPVKISQYCVVGDDEPFPLCVADWSSNALTVQVFGTDPTAAAQLDFLRTHRAELLRFVSELEVVYDR